MEGLMHLDYGIEIKRPRPVRPVPQTLTKLESCNL